MVIDSSFFVVDTVSDSSIVMTRSASSTQASLENTMPNKGSLQDAVQGKGVHIDSDNHICWDEDADQHPRNWNFGTKTYTAALICWLEMYMTAISSSGVSLVTATDKSLLTMFQTATADSAREEYGVSRTMAYFAFVTM